MMLGKAFRALFLLFGCMELTQQQDATILPCWNPGFPRNYCDMACGSTAVSSKCDVATGDCLCNFSCSNENLESALCPAKTKTSLQDTQACFGDCRIQQSSPGFGVLCDVPDLHKYAVCSCVFRPSCNNVNEFARIG